MDVAVNDSMQGKAYRLLRQMMDDGRIRPGEKLLEVQVAKAFGISRSPARMALRMLCAEHRIAPAQGRGYIVEGVNPGGRVVQAILDEIKIHAEPQWERMYRDVEQELCIRILFGSVRVTEERMAEHFGVSRTVVRDVLGRMHSVGLVAKDDTGHWIAHRVTPDRIRHLYELRWLLEPRAMTLAAPYIPRAQLEQARANVQDAIADYPASSEDMDRVEVDLHIDCLSHCPNKELLRALERTHVLFVPTRYLEDPYLGIPAELIHAALHEHVSIIEDLLRGKTRAAAACLHEHLKVADERWLRRFEITARMTQVQFPPYLAPLEGGSR